MEIEIRNRGCMYVFEGGKSMRLTGELSVGPEYTFFVDSISLKSWSVGGVELDTSEKEIVKKLIINEGAKINVKIVFD